MIQKYPCILVLLFSLFLGGVLEAFNPRSAGSEEFLIKFATVAPEGSTWVNHMRELDKGVRVKTKGQVQFRIYPGGVAGDELDVLKKIRIGQIHCAGFSGVGFGQVLPMVRVLDLPFLFRNDQEIDLTQEKMEGFFADHFRQKGFEFLAWAEIGNVRLFSQSPIRKVGDLVGRKIWAWSGDPIAKETFSAMGTNPVLLAFTDVTTGLNTGMIDTVYAPPLGALALQWNLYTKYMTSLPLAHSTGAVLLAKNFSERLPPDLLQTLKKEFRASMEVMTADLRKQEKEAIAVMEKSGIQILPLPAEPDLKDFYNVHDRVAQALAGKMYSKDLLERVYGILKRHR